MSDIIVTASSTPINITVSTIGAQGPPGPPSGTVGGGSSVENVVYATGDQLITGVKTFVSSPMVSGRRLLRAGEILRDGMDTQSLDYGNRFLKNVLGVTVVNWDGHTIYDSDSFQVMNWDDRHLFDFSADLTLDWENRLLTGGPWTAQSIIVSGRRLIGDGEVLKDISNISSIDYRERSLVGPSTVVVVNWAEQILNDNAAELSADWANRRLFDNVSSLTLDWSNRILTGAWSVESLTVGGGNITTGGPYYPLSSNPAGYISQLSSNLVYTTGTQIISGNKTFGTGIVVNGSGYFGDSLTVNGHLQATSKSFIIPHPEKEGYNLQYGVTESPEHSVFIRGKNNTDFIQFPYYWNSLVDIETVTVNITPLKINNSYHVYDVCNSGVTIKCQNDNYLYYYQIFAERKDIPRLEVEVKI